MGTSRDASSWTICLDTSDSEAYAALASDRIWNSFALADLLPPWRSHTQIALARRVDDARQATCLVLRQPELRVVSPDGDAEGLAVLLRQMDLPDAALIQARALHLPAIERHYRPQAPWREMLRMAVAPSSFQAPPDGKPSAEPLTAADLPELMALYRLYPDGHFDPSLLEHGVFFGVREGKHLVAAGGTHVVAATYGLAVLGNVFTHPEARNRGYASRVVATLVGALAGRGMGDVVLNVDANNQAAISVYERLGFVAAYRYLTGLASRMA